jgi:hypothetical protein
MRGGMRIERRMRKRSIGRKRSYYDRTTTENICWSGIMICVMAIIVIVKMVFSR